MISHEHKCIFVEVPKTGSTSVRAILGKAWKPHLNLWQIKQLMESSWTQYGGRKNRIIAALYLLVPEERRRETGRRQFESYFKFGFNKGWSTDYPRFLADLTGDGRPDIVGFGMDGVWVALNNGSGGFQPAALVSGDLAYNTGWRVGNHPRFVADLTGDGHADLLGFGDDGVWVALGNGDGTFAPAQFVLAELGFNKGWRVEDHPRFLADVNGDGRPDIVGFGTDGVWVAINNGAGGFQPAAFVLADFGRASNHDLVVRREIVRDMRPRDRIKHLFVLMLENRSYDHLLGWADIQGTDAANGQPTTADGLDKAPSSTPTPAPYIRSPREHRTSRSRPATISPTRSSNSAGPRRHTRTAGRIQTSATPGSCPTSCGGTAADPRRSCAASTRSTLPVLTQLATEFAVCDRWFSSLPGPTKPQSLLLARRQQQRVR